LFQFFKQQMGRNFYAKKLNVTGLDYFERIIKNGCIGGERTLLNLIAEYYETTIQIYDTHNNLKLTLPFREPEVEFVSRSTKKIIEIVSRLGTTYLPRMETKEKLCEKQDDEREDLQGLVM
jgi:hypothetical protein